MEAVVLLESSQLFEIKPIIELIYKVFKDEGYEIFVVGGCLRDLLLGHLPHDWDFATSALPDEMIQIAEKYKFKYYELGKKHGTIAYLIEDDIFEITTFRKEVAYTNFRSPSAVNFVKQIQEDLERRDFTINALAYAPLQGIIDLYGGAEDLNSKIIRAVGDPEKRFNEDALRMLRAIRFSCQLDFKIEHETYDAIKKLSGNLQYISCERIQSEFNKILLTDKAVDGVRILVDTGLIDYIVPELKATIGFNQQTPYHDKTVFEHILAVMSHTPAVLELRLAALLHDIQKPQSFSLDEKGVGHFYGHEKKGAQVAIEILRRLKYPEQVIEHVSLLINYHMLHFDEKTSDKAIKRAVEKIKPLDFLALLELEKADILGTALPNRAEALNEIRKRYQAMLEDNQAFGIKDLAINGRDLMALGVQQGPRIGQILELLLDFVLDFPEKNHRATLLDEAKKYL